MTKVRPKRTSIFRLPLGDDGSRAGDHDSLDLLSHDHLAQHEPGFNGLAEADVIGDEEVHSRQVEGLAKWFQLVGHHLDSRTVRSLEQPWVRGGHQIPADRIEVGGELVRGIEAAAGHVVPETRFEDARIDLAFPEDGEPLTLRVIVEAGEIDEGLFPGGVGGRLDALDEIPPGPHLHNRARLRLRARLSPSAVGLFDHGYLNVTKVSKTRVPRSRGRRSESAL